MLSSLPGFREFYPDQCALRNHFFRLWRQTALHFGFLEYDAPVLEPLGLYTQKSGEEITSQLFTFEDQGGRAVALRPEMTPSLARLVGAKLTSLKKPVKWFHIGEHFRYEKPQKGRSRAFYQFNADILGEKGAGADVELIALCIESLRIFGLNEENVQIQLSDRQLWMIYLMQFGFDDDEAIKVLNVIDKLGRETKAIIRSKLAPFFSEDLDRFLSELDTLAHIRELADLRAFFEETISIPTVSEKIALRLNEWDQLLSQLGHMRLKSFVQINLGIVRGLAYYTGFVFEAFAVGTKGRSLAGGGRYDHLLEKLGYDALPACGFAIGDVPLAAFLEEKKLLPTYVQKPDIYIVMGGDAERNAALKDVIALRRLGFQVEYSLRAIAFGKQFRQANDSGARFALIYGAEEVAVGNVKVRNLSDGKEQDICQTSLLKHIQTAFL